MNSYVKLAITGGPSGGKTTLIEALKKELGSKCAVVPEAASILYRGGFPRYKDPQAIVHAQTAIYYTQRELEDLVAVVSQKRLVVCDRGSLDSVAYWPEDEGHFFKTLNSKRETIHPKSVQMQEQFFVDSFGVRFNGPLKII